MNVNFFDGEKPAPNRWIYFFKIPSIFHGILTGGILLVSKMVFYWGGNWTTVLDVPFTVLSFLLLLYSMWMALSAERKIWLEHFTYFKAVFTGIRVIVIALALSIFADALLYNLDLSLNQIAIDFHVEKFMESYGRINFIKDSDKDAYIKILKEYKPNEISALWSAWMGKVLLNSIFAFLMALVLRSRKKSSFSNEN
jgi:hypothetical protein